MSIQELRRMARCDAEDGGDGAWITQMGYSTRVVAILQDERKKALAELAAAEAAFVPTTVEAIDW
jgi:hypothetical protein